MRIQRQYDQTESSYDLQRSDLVEQITAVEECVECTRLTELHLECIRHYVAVVRKHAYTAPRAARASVEADLIEAWNNLSWHRVNHDFFDRQSTEGERSINGNA